MLSFLSGFEYHSVMHIIAFFLGFVTLVSAHFQLQYPPPRSKFDEEKEPSFCGGFSVVSGDRYTSSIC
jgi:hypothetical protein